ncbi:Cupredoxin [Phyllosticta citrichinensis]|uniref:Cupredoxin n=1 Tax=Phyllosticta citrichinensis TaxID=1130410 RepID=A0ABR1Y7M6_9PEZI
MDLLSLFFLSWLGVWGAWAFQDPHIVVHDDSFVPDAVLRVTEQEISIGCIKRKSAVANGTVPGPTLRFKSGSVVWVRVYNDMTDHNLTMHWHGLTMAVAPWADGTPRASQFEIGASFYFDYEINLIDVGPGTYFHHSHVDFQAMTVFGPLIIEQKPGIPPPYDYDEEKIVMFSDLYEKVDDDIKKQLTQKPFKWTGETGALLINGHGFANYTHTNKDESCSVPVFNVEAGKTYRFRWIGATALSFVSVGIEEHNLTLIEADGDWLKAYEVPFLQIASGQRYSTLVKGLSCDQIRAMDRTQFYMQAQTRDRPTSFTSFAILDFGTSCDFNATKHIDNLEPPPKPPIHLPPTVQGWLDYDLQNLTPEPDFPTADEVTRTVYVNIFQLTTDLKSKDEHVTWLQNGVSWYEESVRIPYLVALYLNGSEFLPNYEVAIANGGVDPNAKAWPFKIGEVIEFIFENTGSTQGGADVHPIHIHGKHCFYIGSGKGEYNRTENEQKLAAAGHTPVVRDSSMLYRYSPKEKTGVKHSWMGWRHRVTQAGVFMMHCHILQHMLMGMQQVLIYGNSTDLLKYPLPLVEGYLQFGGPVYGTKGHPPAIVHFFDAEDDQPDGQVVATPQGDPIEPEGDPYKSGNYRMAS